MFAHTRTLLVTLHIHNAPSNGSVLPDEELERIEMWRVRTRLPCKQKFIVQLIKVLMVKVEKCMCMGILQLQY